VIAAVILSTKSICPLSQGSSRSGTPLQRDKGHAHTRNCVAIMCSFKLRVYQNHFWPRTGDDAPYAHNPLEREHPPYSLPVDAFGVSTLERGPRYLGTAPKGVKTALRYIDI